MNDYGGLITPQIKIHRQYFREMVKLLGVNVMYRAPMEGKHYTTYAEIDSNYYPPILTGCIFEDHPSQKTLRKLNWVSELSENAAIITVEYDLKGLEHGGIFIVPTGLDDGKAKVFRVSKISTSMIYPASITCEIVPEWEDTLDQTELFDYSPGPNEFKTFDNEEDEKFIRYIDEEDP